MLCGTHNINGEKNQEVIQNLSDLEVDPYITPSLAKPNQQVISNVILASRQFFTNPREFLD